MPLTDPPPTQASASSSRRYAFMLTLWAEEDGATTIWRGSIEAPDGRRTYFQTLADLAHILCQWHICLGS